MTQPNRKPRNTLKHSRVLDRIRREAQRVAFAAINKVPQSEPSDVNLGRLMLREQANEDKNRKR